MGEQISMETLNSFVDAAWTFNNDAHWPAIAR
jgi:hypothetical protein